MDNEIKRNEWIKGVVIEIIFGGDGEIGTANMLTDENILLRLSNKFT